MSKPNIVFIYSDQHRGDAVGCAGHPVIKTPHLDRLGSEGVVFSQCYTNGPICMPARATMMTGQYVREQRNNWLSIIIKKPVKPTAFRRGSHGGGLAVLGLLPCRIVTEHA